MENFNKITLIKKNIINNFNEFKKIDKKTKICVVVKANAYGHGIKGVVNCLKSRADFFAVTNFSEAVTVRLLTNKPILILSAVEKNNIIECINNNISLSVSSLKYLNIISNIATRLGKKARVHLKINTGMNRLGFSKKSNFLKAVKKIENCNNLILEGVFTHFFDSKNIYETQKQNNFFIQYLNLITSRQNIIIHAAATNTAHIKSLRYDMVRIGLGVYGYTEVDNNLNLKPALLITSKIIHKQYVKKGESVSYSSNFIAQKNMQVAVVNLGYGDGYLRSNSNNSKVIIMNNYAKVVGNVCMDLFLCDVTNIKCKVGDDVIVLGGKKDKKIDANNLALLNNTIPYEILTNFKQERFLYNVI